MNNPIARFIPASVALLLWQAALFWGAEEGIVPAPVVAGRATTDVVAYRQFAGAKARQAREDNALKMEFAWCLPGSFGMGPIQRIGGKLVNENQAFEDLHQRLEQPEKEWLQDLEQHDAEGDGPSDSDENEPIGNRGAAGSGKSRRETEVFFFHGFWLGKHEVTRGEWKAIMETEPWVGRKVVVSGDDYPATYVSWNGAMDFCRKLTEIERTAGRLPAHWEYTLPTEAQWERACRAHTTTRYSFGDGAEKLTEYAWFNANSSGRGEPFPHRVGQKKPNPWGLYDMHGNVLEWCRDAYTGTLPGGRNPEVTRGRERVLRGGDFDKQDSACHSSARYCEPPELKKLGFGFRVTLSYIE
jgi:sulfatase modifying factor 1